ncbi:hypothetical protein QJQ45_017267 [Haematococcus lacustris]|nr:hypothetical protein QJQ45_017267 [Haematococcus lacustris]
MSASVHGAACDAIKTNSCCAGAPLTTGTTIATPAFPIPSITTSTTIASPAFPLPSITTVPLSPSFPFSPSPNAGSSTVWVGPNPVTFRSPGLGDSVVFFGPIVGNGRNVTFTTCHPGVRHKEVQCGCDGLVDQGRASWGSEAREGQDA